MTNEVLEKTVDSDPTDVDRAVSVAHVAFESAYPAAPSTRADWLMAVSDALETSSDELVSIALSETHLLEGRLRGELARTVFQVRLLATELRSGTNLHATIDHANPAWPMGPRPDLRRVNEPLGVVGVFGASNFPFAFSVIGGDSASALAAGCAVVNKAHPAHERLAQRTADVVKDALRAAGAPIGIFEIVFGRDAGTALVEHPLVKAIGFTGSTSVGLSLQELAARRPEPIPFFGELGSTNPVFVTEAAWATRRRQILTEYVLSVALGMGQLCTKPGFLFVPATSNDELAQAMESAMSSVMWHPMLTSGLAASFAESLSLLSSDPRFTEVLLGRSPDVATVPSMTILTAPVSTIRTDPSLLEHEMFGPASVIVQYEDEAELIEVADLSRGQLTMSIQADPDEQLTDLVRKLAAHSGRVLWNEWPTGVTVSFAQQHGGPFPSTTAPDSTSVGTAAVTRFMRPIAYQNFPSEQLPPALRDDNPWAIAQRVDGEWTATR
jgi:acyl-CoA reductase-like NAD-dependent aldehyde dehydrogenase